MAFLQCGCVKGRGVGGGGALLEEFIIIIIIIISLLK